MEEKEIYIGEYSSIQNCYHIDTLDNVIKANLSITKRNIDTGYIPIAWGYSFMEVSEKLDEIRKSMPEVSVIKQAKEGYLGNGILKKFGKKGRKHN